MPFEFYHTTNKYESSLKKDYTTICNKIQDELRNRLIRKYPQKFIPGNGSYVDISSLKITSLKTTGESVKFDVFGDIYNSDLKHEWYYHQHINISSLGSDEIDTLLSGEIGKLLPIHIYSLWSTSTTDSVINKILEISLKPTSPRFRFFNREASDPGAYPQDEPNNIKPKAGQCFLTIDIIKDIEAYRAALDGFPYYSSGNYERMLYLSAMIITTVGSGDILPVSRRARLAVSVEAVFGIIVIGLFLNSLAAKIVNAKRTAHN